MHKNPYKARFIAGSRKCTTKTLSVLLTQALKQVKTFWENYCSVIRKNSGIECMWILKNSQILTELLDTQGQMLYKYVSTWDFSTLYTNIPHKDLIDRLSKLIISVFKKTGHTYVNVRTHKAFFSSKIYQGYQNWDVTRFIELLEFLIGNIYVKFGSTLYQQHIGIPMGTNCAPLLADLYLFTYEYDYMQRLIKKKELHKAKSFNFTYRYIDDLITIQNSYINDAVKEIYPPSLELKETTDSPDGTSYLDLYLFKDDNGFISRRLYDKRDDYNFAIVNYPFLDSNIPTGPAYGTYISRLIAFARACQSLQDFNQRHQVLIKKLVSQGYNIKRLHSKFLNFGFKYQPLLAKYNVNVDGLWKAVV